MNNQFSLITHPIYRLALYELIGFMLLILFRLSFDLVHKIPLAATLCGVAINSVVALVILGITCWQARRIFYLNKFHLICAWCNKISDKKKQAWIYPDKLSLLTPPESKPTHGICPICAERVKQEITDGERGEG